MYALQERESLKALHSRQLPSCLGQLFCPAPPTISPSEFDLRLLLGIIEISPDERTDRNPVLPCRICHAYTAHSLITLFGNIKNMNRLGTIKRLVVITIIITTVVAAWFSHDRKRHRIDAFLPDGTHAPNLSVVLDYDPIYDYHPTTIGGSDGTVYISRSRAYGQGWETLKIRASRDGKNYYAQRYPSECSYPMRVTLNELPPAPPPKSTLQQASTIFKFIKRSAQESRR